MNLLVFRKAILLAAAIAITTAAHATAPLRSPWDSTPVPASQQPYDCPRPPYISPDISIGTLRPSSNGVSESVKAAAYAESGGALADFARNVVAAADTYRQTGSLPAAHCAGALLAAAAEEHAMAGFMGDDLAWQAQDRALRSAAIAYLKVRGSGAIVPAQSSLILAWMTDILHQERVFYERSSCSSKVCGRFGHRNHEVAMASAAIGIASNDRGEFKWAIDQYRSAVEDVNEHGMLHYDTRGRWALKWNLESAAALVQIAEFGEINGEPLYAYDHGYIHLLVHSVTRGLVDPSPFKLVTKKDQVTTKTLEPWEISWASVYNSRFPDPVVTALLQEVGPEGADMWGGESWNATAAESD